MQTVLTGEMLKGWSKTGESKKTQY